MQRFIGTKRCGNSANRRPGQVCVFSAGSAPLMGVQFHLWLWIMQPGSLVLPGVCRWGKPWDGVYRYLHSERRLLSVRDWTRWKRIRMRKTWGLEMSRWPLSVVILCITIWWKNTLLSFSILKQKGQNAFEAESHFAFIYICGISASKAKQWCLSLSLSLKLWLIYRIQNSGTSLTEYPA